MIDFVKGVFKSGPFIKIFLNGYWCNINEEEYPAAWGEVQAYLAEHPEALVDEPKPTEPTAEQKAQQEISVLKSNLLSTDYIPAKIGDALALGISTTELQEKYREKLLEREKWRIRIRELEGII